MMTKAIEDLNTMACLFIGSAHDNTRENNFALALADMTYAEKAIDILTKIYNCEYQRRALSNIQEVEHERK